MQKGRQRTSTSHRAVDAPCSGVLAVEPKVDHPTRTLALALTRTQWDDQCLDAVACEISIDRLIRPAWMLCLERL